jgi:hypothetical protein
MTSPITALSQATSQSVRSALPRRRRSALSMSRERASEIAAAALAGAGLEFLLDRRR